MYQTMAMAGAAALAVSAGAFAQTDPHRCQQQDLMRGQAAARAEARIAWLDLNRDRLLTREEMQQAMQQRRQRMSQLSPEQLARIEQRRAQRGGEGTGRAKVEHTAPCQPRSNGEQALQRFDRPDADRNGVISAAEVQQARAQRAQRKCELLLPISFP